MELKPKAKLLVRNKWLLIDYWKHKAMWIALATINSCTIKHDYNIRHNGLFVQNAKHCVLNCINKLFAI